MKGDAVDCVHAPPFSLSLCVLCHVPPTEEASISLLLDSEFGQVTYFGQWHVSRRDKTSGLGLWASATGLR